MDGLEDDTANLRAELSEQQRAISRLESALVAASEQRQRGGARRKLR